LRFAPESKLLNKTIEEIKDVIKAAGGVFPASRILGVAHTTIYDRLNVAGITLDDIMMEYQREIAPAIIDNDKLTGDYIISADYHCVDSESEILTNNGWKTINTINEKDKPLTVNPQNLQLEYKEIRKIIKYNYVGDMYRWLHRDHDLLVTPEHQIPHLNLHNFRQPILQFKPAKDINKLDRSINNGLCDWEDAPYSDAQIKLMAWINTEGTVRETGRTFVYQSDHSHHCEEIRNTLNELEIDFDERTNPLTGFNRYPMKVFSFKQYLIRKSKQIPNIKFSRRQAQLYIDTFRKGDGDIGRFRISQKSPSMIDKLMEFTIIAGMSPSVRLCKGEHPFYRMSCNSTGVFYYRNRQTEHYNGIVWCIATDNKTIFVRRNGKVTLTGNSPFISMLWLNRLLSVAKKENIKQLVIGGDFGDIDRLSWWLRQKQAEDIAVKLDDELAFTEMILEKLFNWFERIDIIGGNHWLRLLGAVTFSVSAKRLMGLVGQKDNPKLHFHGLFNWLLIDNKVRVTHPAKARKLDWTLSRDLSQLHPGEWLVLAHRHRGLEGFTPDGRPMIELGWMGDAQCMRYITYTDSPYYLWNNGFAMWKDGVLKHYTEYNFNWREL